MVVLNIYSKIEPICISKKLGLYIGNIINSKFGDWKEELVDVLTESKEKIIKNELNHSLEKRFDFRNEFKKILKDDYNDNESDNLIIDKVVDT